MKRGLRVACAHALVGLLAGADACAQTAELPDDVDALLRSGRAFHQRQDWRTGDAGLADFPRAVFLTRPAAEDLARAASPEGLVIVGAPSPLHGRISAALAVDDSLTLADVADRIDKAVRDHQQADGVLIIAMIDVARFDEGIIRVSLVRPTVGEVEIVGAPPRLRRYLSALALRMRAGGPLRQGDMERYLLLLNRIPGCTSRISVATDETKTAGAALTIRIEYDRVIASAKFNNLAGPAIGREILSGKLVVNDLFAPADFADLRVFSSFAPGDAVFFDGTYGVNLDTDGRFLEIGAFHNDIRPDRSRAGGVDVKINNTFLSASVVQPVLLREKSQVFVGAGLAYGRTVIGVDGVPLLDEERWLLQAEAKWALDALGGANTVTLGLNQGLDVFGATERGGPSTPRGGEGASFSYLVLEVAREQAFADWARLVTEAYAQASTRALFVPDQCAYGGRDFGRAFNLNALFGDNCFLALSELQLRPGFLRGERGRIEPYLYADGGMLHQVGAADPAQPRNAARMSAGAGVRLLGEGGFSARFEFTQALRRNTPIGAGDERSLFFEIVQDF